MLKQNTDYNAALLEKVITCNDLAGLSSSEKVEHIKNICLSLNLNPLTKPIQLLKFNGKEIAYFTKDATEQLRKLNNVSINKIEKTIEYDICIITVYAQTPDGRKDASSGATNIGGLKGEALCNAILKAETKAKRRVTLSICGLGMIDESEADSIAGSKKHDLSVIPEKIIKKVGDESTKLIANYNIDDMVDEIAEADDLNKLEDLYRSHYRLCAVARDAEGLRKIIEAKDAAKKQLESISNFVAEMDFEETEKVNERDDNETTL